MSWLKKSSGLSQAIWLSCWLLYIYAFKATLRRTSSFVFVTALVIKLLLWYLCFFFLLSLLFYVNVIRKKKNTFLVYFFSFSCKDFLLLSAETLWSWKSSQWTKVLLWLFFFFFFQYGCRSSVICQKTALPHLSLPRGSTRENGNPSQSPSDRLVFIKLLVTSFTSTLRVIISLSWPDCHHHPHHYPMLSLLSIQ